MPLSIPEQGEISLLPIAAAIDQVVQAAREIHDGDPELRAALLDELVEIRRQVTDICNRNDGSRSFMLPIAGGGSMHDQA